MLGPRSRSCQGHYQSILIALSIIAVDLLDKIFKLLILNAAFGRFVSTKSVLFFLSTGGLMNRVQMNHTISVARVSGTVTAQYIQK